MVSTSVISDSITLVISGKSQLPSDGNSLSRLRSTGSISILSMLLVVLTMKKYHCKEIVYSTSVN